MPVAVPKANSITDEGDYEIVRETFRPASVRLLFVGESRPANGTFFYLGDSRLAKYTREALGFENQSSSAFLEGFRSLGCFLIDLCPNPVNNLPPVERRNAQKACEGALAERLRAIQPRAIVVVMKGIAASVAEAAGIANLQAVPRRVVPFPAQGHEREYVAALRVIMRGIRAEAMIIPDLNSKPSTFRISQ